MAKNKEPSKKVTYLIWLLLIMCILLFFNLFEIYLAPEQEFKTIKPGWVQECTSTNKLLNNIPSKPVDCICNTNVNKILFEKEQIVCGSNSECVCNYNVKKAKIKLK